MISVIMYYHEYLFNEIIDMNIAKQIKIMLFDRVCIYEVYISHVNNLNTFTEYVIDNS